MIGARGHPHPTPNKLFFFFPFLTPNSFLLKSNFSINMDDSNKSICFILHATGNDWTP